MNEINILNFFNEKEYKKRFKMKYVGFIIIILGCMTINLRIGIKIKNLEEEIFKKNENLNMFEEVNYLESEKIHIEKSNEILKLIKHINTTNLEIENKKIKIKGQAQDPNQIKYFLNEIKEVNNLKNCSVDSIVQENSIYKFDIHAILGKEQDE